MPPKEVWEGKKLSTLQQFLRSHPEIKVEVSCVFPGSPITYRLWDPWTSTAYTETLSEDRLTEDNEVCVLLNAMEELQERRSHVKRNKV